MSFAGKYAIVTGGNAGIGLETVKGLARQGFHVTISARSLEKGQEAISTVRAEYPDAQLRCMVMELKELASVRRFAAEYISSGLPLHLLVNNAGIMGTALEVTGDGFEAQFQVNHLSHFLLTHLLLPVISRSGGGRVVVLASRAHMRFNRPLDMAAVHETAATYDAMAVYGRSKLCNILFARSVAAKFPVAQSKVSFNALHPGLVNTKLLDTVKGLKASAIPVGEGAQTSLYLSTSAEVEGVSGLYFQDCKQATDPSLVTPFALSDEEAQKLWDASLQMVGLSDEEYGR